MLNTLSTGEDPKKILQTIRDLDIAENIIIGFTDNDNKQFISQGKNNGKNIDLNTYIDIASITKPIINILGLLELKKHSIKISHNVGDFLGYLNGFNIKIEDLLTHTHGITIKKEFRFDKTKNYSIDEFKNILEDKNHLEKTNPSYSNLSNLFFGQIIEKISGKNLDILLKDFVNKHNLKGLVYNPMKNLDSHESILPTSPTGTTGIVHDPIARYYGGVTGCAGIFANMDGLISFGLSWLQNKFEFEEKFFDKQNFGYEAGKFGLVWKFSEYDREILKFTGHTGTIFLLNPQKRKILITFCNLTYRDTAQYMERRERYRDLERTFIKILKS